MRLSLQALGFRHGTARRDAAAALHSISIEVARGECVAVIGASGAGKSTLLEVLACARRPTAGRFLIDGRDPWAIPRAQLQRLRRRIFLAPQVPPLPPRQRVVTSVLAGRLPAMGLLASLRSLLYPIDIPAAYEALERFELGEKIFERVDRLSGGERQRVGLARALLAPAAAWFVDEPLSALDPELARRAIEALPRLARERGVTLVTTLHQVDAALERFPRIIGLRDGAVAFDLAAGDVTEPMLEHLYAPRDGSPTSDASAPGAPSLPQAAPAAVYCR